MSFQAYLDTIEQKTGHTPNDFIAIAKTKGFDNPNIKAGVIIEWLKNDFDLGRGHAMALVHVIKTVLRYRINTLAQPAPIATRRIFLI